MENPAEVALDRLEALMEKNPFLRDLWGNARKSRESGPPADVLRADEAWILQIELPGMRRDEITVLIDGSRLVVRGEKPLARPLNAKVHLSERQGGAFERRFELSADADPAGIRATLRDGVLQITVPRLAGGVRAVEVETTEA